MPTTPPCTFGGATVEPSGVAAEMPTPSAKGTGTPAERRERAAAANAGPALVWVGVGLVPALSNSARKIFLYAAGGEAVVLRWSAARFGSAVCSSG